MSIAQRRGLLSVLAWACVAACGTDVRLGGGPDAAIDAPIDAPLDAVMGVFPTGAHTVTFLDPVHAECDGSLIGMEASFETITRASANLVDGIVMLTMPTTTVLSISGTPIVTAFEQANISLVLNPDSDPEMIWDAEITANFGSGPLGAEHVARAFAIDGSTVATPPLRGVIVMLYQTTDSTGACSVAFGASLASQ